MSSCLAACRSSTAKFSHGFHQKLCTQAVLRPCLTLSVIIFTVIFLTTLAFLTKADFPDEDQRSKDSVDMWRVRDNEIMRTEDAYYSALGHRARWVEAESRFETEQEYIDWRDSKIRYPSRHDVKELLFGPAPVQSSELGGRTQIYYRSVDRSRKIFTPQNLKAMCLLERVWHEIGKLGDKSKFYQSGARISRMVQIYAGNLLNRPFTFPITDCDVTATMSQQQVDTIVNNEIYAKYNSGDYGYGFFLDRDFPTNGYAVATRSGFSGLDGEDEIGGEGLDKLQEFLGVEDTFFNPRFLYEKWYILPNSHGQVEVRIMDPLMKDAAGQELALGRDLTLGLPLTFIAVWVVVYVHTGSLFSACLVLLFVLFAMMGGFIGYYLLARLAYFDSFLQLTLFVMLAVGADNFFVMWEAVKIEKEKANVDGEKEMKKEHDLLLQDHNSSLMIQKSATVLNKKSSSASSSPQHQPLPKAILNTKSRRKVSLYLALLRASKRASASMFETSFTTAMAFFSMVMSKVSPVAHFGFFAGFMIVSGYVLAVIAFPQVIGLFYLRFEKGGRSFPEVENSGSAPEQEQNQNKFGASTTAAVSAWEEGDKDEDRSLVETRKPDATLADASTTKPDHVEVEETVTKNPAHEVAVDGEGEHKEQAEDQEHHPVGKTVPSRLYTSMTSVLQPDTVQNSLHKFYKFLTKYERELRFCASKGQPGSFTTSTTAVSPRTTPSACCAQYKFYPIALAIVVATTAYSVWLLTLMLDLQSPSKPFEFMPETHMMVGFRKDGYQMFLSSGGNQQYRPVHIVYGLNADEPLQNADEFSKWFPWKTNAIPNFYFDSDPVSVGANPNPNVAQTRSVTNVRAVSHVLRVGERLKQTACADRPICKKRHVSGKLFVPEAMSCGIRNMFKVNSTARDDLALPRLVGVNNTPVATPGPLGALYYNVPDAVLFPQPPAIFNYSDPAVVQHPFFPAPNTLPSGEPISLTKPAFVAEAHYRAQDFSWSEHARRASLLTEEIALREREAQQDANLAEVDWVELSDSRHPGETNFSRKIFTFNETYWRNIDFKLYATTVFAPVLSGDGAGVSFKEMDSLYHAVQDILDEENQHAPAELGKAVQIGDYGYYVLNLELRNTLFGGLLLMIPLCFGLLVLASGNVIVSVLAIYNVSFLTMQVMGYFKLLGWELGLLESLAGIIVIGLAMDYTLHFCHVFVEAGKIKKEQVALYSASTPASNLVEDPDTTDTFEKPRREQRVEHAFLFMGPTIFAGFVTSASAGLFLMIFSITPFFKQMGIAIFLTILTSVYMSLCYLPCLLLLFGPERRFGDFSYMGEIVAERVSGRVSTVSTGNGTTPGGGGRAPAAAEGASPEDAQPDDAQPAG
ncbi:unnamed protein product [Amoebophrya sp. A120]|nr:unnamed protein product [Amoebophrya sp. A120]|eukprot:GSA120T00007417001.1